MNPAPEHADHPLRPPRWTGLVVTVCILAAGIAIATVVTGRGPSATGPIEHEVKSDFSHIRVRRDDDIRTLTFVEDNGQEVIESQVDLIQPHRLMLPYTRTMFASYLFVPQQERVLIVGLGGGGMVHFLRHFDSELRLEVVEIDPVIIEIAEKYFGVSSEGNVRIIHQDARRFIQQEGPTYDVIYMDAFLGASEGTDVSGVPLHLKTLPFFQQLQKRLSPEGAVVFNLHRHRNHDEDVRAIRAAFGQVYVFRVPARGNVVVVATMSDARLDGQTLLARAAELDRSPRAGFSFRRLVVAD
jgi:spermidine synthase